MHEMIFVVLSFFPLSGILLLLLLLLFMHCDNICLMDGFDRKFACKKRCYLLYYDLYIKFHTFTHVINDFMF